MARARNIKPAIMDNEELSELPAMDRLLFIYLWMLADREGRLEDRPKRIAKQALAYDRDADVDEIIGRLAGAGFVQRYSWAGVPYLQITNFVKHQAPHGTEKDSLIPDSKGLLTVHQRGKNGYSTGVTVTVSCPATVKGGSQAASDNSALTVKDSGPDPSDNSSRTVSDPMSEGGENTLIPDLLIPDSLIPEIPPIPPKGGGRRSVIDPDEEPEGFAPWYALYRRKDAKRDAIKAWRQLAPDQVLQARLIAALVAWRWSDDRTKNPLPASWLRGRRWEDEAVSLSTAVVGVPVWCSSAGFANVFEAANAGCWEHTAAMFRDGRRQVEGVSA